MSRRPLPDCPPPTKGRANPRNATSENLLFRLPRELRDRVYDFALSSPHPVVWPSATNPFTPRSAGLLRTCRHVYAEAAPVLYRHNRFRFRHPSDGNMFVHVMDRAHAPRCVTEVCLAVRDRDVRLWTSYVASGTAARSLTYDFPALKRLRILFRADVLPLPSHLMPIHPLPQLPPPYLSAHLQWNWAALQAQQPAHQMQLHQLMLLQQHLQQQPGPGGFGGGVGGPGGPAPAELVESFSRWHEDPNLDSLCINLKENYRSAAERQLVVLARLPATALRALCASLPGMLALISLDEVHELEEEREGMRRLTKPYFPSYTSPFSLSSLDVVARTRLPVYIHGVPAWLEIFSAEGWVGES